MKTFVATLGLVVCCASVPAGQGETRQGWAATRLWASGLAGRTWRVFVVRVPRSRRGTPATAEEVAPDIAKKRTYGGSRGVAFLAVADDVPEGGERRLVLHYAALDGDNVKCRELRLPKSMDGGDLLKASVFGRGIRIAISDQARLRMAAVPFPYRRLVLASFGESPVCDEKVAAEGELFGQPVWSPDGRYVALYVDTPPVDGKSLALRLWDMESGLGAVGRDVYHAEGGFCINPGCYPDLVWENSRRLAFSTCGLPHAKFRRVIHLTTGRVTEAGHASDTAPVVRGRATLQFHRSVEGSSPSIVVSPTDGGAASARKIPTPADTSIAELSPAGEVVAMVVAGKLTVWRPWEKEPVLETIDLPVRIRRLGWVRSADTPDVAPPDTKE